MPAPALAQSPSDGPHDCTVFLSDIEDSTRLWEQHPDEMIDVVREHNELIMQLVRDAHGRLVRLTGDGVFALFDDGADAVEASVIVQREFMRHEWPAIGPVRIRIGLNSGRCVVHDGEVFGRAPNLASRLQSIGHGGQILLSDTTAAACTGRLPPLASMVDLGRYHIRGLAQPVVVHMVVAEGMSSQFPPLRTAYVGFDELPLDDPVVYGRDVELRDIDELIGTVPLVTLWGPGGVGKTRLAQRVAAQSGGRYRDGARMVHLNSATEPRDVARLTSAALRAQPLEGESPSDTVMRVSRSAQLLLILDNCEHVLEGTREFVARVLTECPGCTILSTSREPLGLRHERALEVRTLAVPGSDERGLEAIWQNPSVRLFVERARQSAREFALTEQNAAAVAAACRAADGLPLALELAGARVGVEGLTADGGGPGMAASIAQSFERLSPSEAHLLLRLSAFAGPFTRELAVTIAGGSTNAGRDLDRLLRVAMVQRDDVVGSSFRLLATTREYAREQLAPDGRAELTSAHACLMLDRAERLGALLHTRHEHQAVLELRALFAEMRVAMEHLLASESIDEASRLLAAIFQFCLFQPRPEAHAWAETLASKIDDDHPLAPEVLGAAAIGAWFTGDTDTAIRLGLRAVATPTSMTPESLVWARTALLDAYAYAGDERAAVPHFVALRATLRASDDAFWRINGLGHEAISLTMTGRADQALAVSQHALQLARGLNNPDCIQWAHYAQGRALAGSDLEAAGHAFEQAMSASREVDSRFNVCLSLIEWVAIMRRLGDRRAAATGALDLVNMLAASGNRSMLSQALAEVARLLRSGGRTSASEVVWLAREGLPSMPRGMGLPCDDDAEQVDARPLSVVTPNEPELIELCRAELEQLVQQRM